MHAYFYAPDVVSVVDKKFTVTPSPYRFIFLCTGCRDSNWLASYIFSVQRMFINDASAKAVQSECAAHASAGKPAVQLLLEWLLARLRPPGPLGAGAVPQPASPGKPPLPSLAPRVSLLPLPQLPHEGARQVGHAERVLEPLARRAGEYVVNAAQLAQVAQPLELRRIHHRHGCGVQLNVPVDRILDDLLTRHDEGSLSIAEL